MGRRPLVRPPPVWLVVRLCELCSRRGPKAKDARPPRRVCTASSPGRRRGMLGRETCLPARPESDAPFQSTSQHSPPSSCAAPVAWAPGHARGRVFRAPVCCRVGRGGRWPAAGRAGSGSDRVPGPRAACPLARACLPACGPGTVARPSPARSVTPQAKPARGPHARAGALELGVLLECGASSPPVCQGPSRRVGAWDARPNPNPPCARARCCARPPLAPRPRPGAPRRVHTCRKAPRACVALTRTAAARARPG